MAQLETDPSGSHGEQEEEKADDIQERDMEGATEVVLYTLVHVHCLKTQDDPDICKIRNVEQVTDSDQDKDKSAYFAFSIFISLLG